jgi:uncharacterized protein YutE (UPF0331/DUF86 family)
MKFSLESLEEALGQYKNGTEKGRKFSILHCDQAIELLLKEKLRSMGCPIFIKGKGGQTIDFHGALDILVNEKGVKIPELANLQLIHEERNVIQHKGATVSPDEAEFYIKEGFDFIKRFSKDELNIFIEDYVDLKNSGFFGPQKLSKTLSGITENEESNITSVLLNYRELEILTRSALEKMGVAGFHSLRESLEILQANKFKIREPQKILAFMQLRNIVAHSEKIPTKIEIDPLIDEVRNLKFRLKRYISQNDDVQTISKP